MRHRAPLVTSAALLLGTLLTLPARPVRADDPKNLKVFATGTTNKELTPLMKALAKTTGVKCDEACHVKGDFSKDDKPGKQAGRDFLKAVLANKDATARKSELDKLLKGIGKTEAKDPSKLWELVDTMKPAKGGG